MTLIKIGVYKKDFKSFLWLSNIDNTIFVRETEFMTISLGGTAENLGMHQWLTGMLPSHQVRHCLPGQ